MCSAQADVRFAPNSGHVQRTSPCPLCAKSGCEQSQHGQPNYSITFRHARGALAGLSEPSAFPRRKIYVQIEFISLLNREMIRPPRSFHSFLIHDLDRAVDLGTGHAKLMGDQLHQQVDPLDERRATRDRPGRR